MTSVALLAKRVAVALDLPPRATKAICEQFLIEIGRELLAGEGVYLHGFGSFVHTTQRCNNDEFYESRGVTPEGEGELHIRVCRFKFVRKMREAINGLQRVDVDAERLDYKTRASGVLEVNGETEAERRARVGITFGDICERLNSEARK